MIRHHWSNGLNGLAKINMYFEYELLFHWYTGFQGFNYSELPGRDVLCNKEIILFYCMCELCIWCIWVFGIAWWMNEYLLCEQHIVCKFWITRKLSRAIWRENWNFEWSRLMPHGHSEPHRRGEHTYIPFTRLKRKFVSWLFIWYCHRPIYPNLTLSHLHVDEIAMSHLSIRWSLSATLVKLQIENIFHHIHQVYLWFRERKILSPS